MAIRSAASRRPRVVIVGAGFGGLVRREGARPGAGRRDGDRPAQLSPLPAAALSGRDGGALACRYRLRRSAASSATRRTPRCMLAKVTGVDIGCDRRCVLGGRRVPFDFLVLATGARHAYFGHDDWEPLRARAQEDRRRDVPAPQDPAGVRARRESRATPAERRRLLTFVVIGGGADRRRDGWRDRRACPQGARGRFPHHRSALGPGDPARGRPAAAARLRPSSCPRRRNARSRSSASRSS